jgi:hypothetical protein
MVYHIGKLPHGGLISGESAGCGSGGNPSQLISLQSRTYQVQDARGDRLFVAPMGELELCVVYLDIPTVVVPFSLPQLRKPLIV